MTILKFLMEYQVVLASIVYIIFVIFVQRVPREELYKMGLPFVKIFVIIFDKFLVKIFGVRKAEIIEEGFICSICYCLERWLRFFRLATKLNNTKMKEGD